MLAKASRYHITPSISVPPLSKANLDGSKLIHELRKYQVQPDTG